MDARGDPSREAVLTTVTATQHRLDLHNSSVNFAVAAAGYCGFLHVASGRICMLPARHASACQLRRPPAQPVIPTHEHTVSAGESADACSR
jgi:hypothetical protein